MDIRLSDHFTYRKLLRFALPSIAMMLFTSVYGIVDGFFVSNFAGKTPFAAINIVWPFIMVLSSLGFMIGTGGCALIGKLLGEQKKEKANGVFSMLIFITIILGTLISVIGFIIVRPVCVLLGADEAMLEFCVPYGRISMLGLTAVMLQYEFQSYFVAAEKPQLGFYVTLIAGVMNIVMDALLVGVFKWGVVGAALATIANQWVGGVVPIVYFARKNTSTLKLGKPVKDVHLFLRACGNGSSEFVSNISMSLVSMLYNIQLMKYGGENGVAAYGVLMYVCMIFLAVFIGYSVGTAPIVSYQFGARNTDELQNLFRKSFTVITAFSFCMLLAGELLARTFASIYVSYDAELMDLTVRAFRIFSFSFLFSGVPIYGSSFFTALNNGLVSAAISFLRTLVFQIAAVLLLPLIWGIDGIWYSLIVAELIATLVTAAFLILKRDRYQYY